MHFLVGYRHMYIAEVNLNVAQKVNYLYDLSGTSTSVVVVSVDLDLIITPNHTSTFARL